MKKKSRYLNVLPFCIGDNGTTIFYVEAYVRTIND